MQAPETDEIELYYYGLPSRPRLVARSSTNVWQRPQMPEFSVYYGAYPLYPKSLGPVVDHPLLNRLWNDAASSLRAQILNAVQRADWTAIDILRVWLDDEYQNTLMIAVKPDTLSWEDGHSVAMQCRAILEDHDIHDVQCEIRESVVTLFTEASAPEQSTPIDFQLSSRPIMTPFEEYQADLSDCISTRISMKHMDSRAGTKGLYLAISSSTSDDEEPAIVALTCRHVVIDPKTEGTEEYRYSEPYKETIQVDQPTHEGRIDTLARGETAYRKYAEKALERGLVDRAAMNLTLANRSTALVELLKQFEAPGSRTFGQVILSPEFGLEPLGSGAAWLRDWALIELLPTNHQAQLGSVRNKLHIGSTDIFPLLVDRGKKGLRGLPIPMPLELENGTIELEATTVSIDQIFRPPDIAEYNDEPAMVVAKKGATTGLTLGLGNTLKSLVRYIETPQGDVKVYSEEWAITSVDLASDRQAQFSKPGDSGSCVWDMDQRPAGILTAGCGTNDINDITYAQPLERLLDGIRFYGYTVSLV